ncbi:hypothetical protein DespoDRAFT_03677 [Desulfobacter postgatei 2ac9]|uniref:Uncharacterized protein n=1 Tax=Desulfobacter postgatei 2ac9 TaxID=879212 RepID=I5B7F4_9BACT|nr:hypothetical protein DespoDRAFT_03677 [Desulfobacter postgatei 2ac9]
MAQPEFVSRQMSSHHEAATEISLNFARKQHYTLHELWSLIF